MKRFAPHVVVLCGLGFYACLGYFTYLARVSPTHPDPLAGLTVRMNDHGYYFFVSPWQGWLLNTGPLACVGAVFVVAAIGQRCGWDWKTIDKPRWLYWLYFGALAACLAYVFYRFP